MSERRTVMIGDCALTVDRYGSGSPVVVLHHEHGTLFGSQFYAELARSHEVVVPHHPGWIPSRRPSYVTTIRDIALIEQELIEGMDQPVDLVGLSLGGWIAAEIAAAVPSIVSTLVLVSPIGLKVGGRTERDFVDLYVMATEDRLQCFYRTGHVVDLPKPISDDFYFEMATADEAVARFCWSPYMHDPSLRYRLRRIQAPTVVMSGDSDGFCINQNYFMEFASLVGSGATHREFASSGHRLEEELPERVAAEIVSHIATITANYAD
jgi:pimeloyl-ACP methyl ester carboxylesterase